MIQTKYRLDLQFFSAESEGRTETATQKKRDDARKKGQVAKSKDLDTAVLIIGFCGVMLALAGYMLRNIKLFFSLAYQDMYKYVETDETLQILSIMPKMITKFLITCLPLWLALMVIAFVISIIQVKYKFTLEPLQPKFSKLNPLSGLKRMFSKDVLITLLLANAKVIVLGLTAVNLIKGKVPLFLHVYRLGLDISLRMIGQTVIELGFNVGGAFLILAALDYVYQRYKHEDSLKMTKQEVKEEWKNAEGNPEIKGKIKQKMRAASMKRMMQAIPDADVIITNPTHFAVALKYDEASGRAPIVVAKGVDYVAQKIKEKARECHVEIVENRPLARSLYYTVDIDREIPPELYGAVAEVLAFVYNMQNKNKK